ncbi:uncharacterized protein AruCF_2892 [Achromobacter ruhlandii]|nr:uncharacterized protein AruCF_2892 [Achromobacter ruhlandii]
MRRAGRSRPAATGFAEWDPASKSRTRAAGASQPAACPPCIERRPATGSRRGTCCGRTLAIRASPSPGAPHVR